MKITTKKVQKPKNNWIGICYKGTGKLQSRAKDFQEDNVNNLQKQLNNITSLVLS